MKVEEQIEETPIVSTKSSQTNLSRYEFQRSTSFTPSDSTESEYCHKRTSLPMKNDDVVSQDCCCYMKKPTVSIELSKDVLDVSGKLLYIEQTQCSLLLQLDYARSGVTHIYNPLDYASVPHSQFVRQYGNSKKRIVFMGMNPGPYGMAQNGVCA